MTREGHKEEEDLEGEELVLECPQVKKDVEIRKSSDVGEPDGSDKSESAEAPQPKDGVVSHPVAEGGWGWACVAGGALIFFISRGLTSSFALVFKELRAHFGSSAMSTAWVYSVFVTTQMCGSPVATALCKRFGCRTMCSIGILLVTLGVCSIGFVNQLWHCYITFGLFAGFGASLSVGIVPMVINMYFHKRRSLAASMALLINGGGNLVFAVLMTYLFLNYGLRGTMLICGGIAYHGMLAAMVFVEPPEWKQIKTGKEPEMDDISTEKRTLSSKMRNRFKEMTNYADVRVFLNPTFAAYSLVMSMLSMCLSMNGVVVAEFFEERDVSPKDIAILLSMYGVISIPMRVVLGAACDRTFWRSRRGGFFGMIVFTIGTAIMLAPLAQEVYQVYVWYAVMGVLTACSSSLETVIIADILGQKKFPDGVGFSRFGRGLGILIGPTCGGAIKDLCGTYDYTYHTSGAILTCASVVFLITLYWKKVTACHLTVN